VTGSPDVSAPSTAQVAELVRDMRQAAAEPAALESVPCPCGDTIVGGVGQCAKCQEEVARK
jgi:hypothetical protein